mgnify:CR=1 FL=1
MKGPSNYTYGRHKLRFSYSEILVIDAVDFGIFAMYSSRKYL